MASYADFKQKCLGKGYDVDGYYGCQCWDGYAWYCKYLNYLFAHCTSSGYVKDIWLNRKTNGILKYFDEVTVMQPGDVAVFKEVPGVTPWSHIAIFDSDAGNGFGWFLGQNQGGKNGAFNLAKLPYSATYATAFRPKCFAKSAQAGTTSKGQSVAPKWDRNATLKVGDIVKSVSCAIKPYGSTGSAIVGTCVYVPELGGLVPLVHISEASDSKDGKVDNYLANLNAKVFLDECKVTGFKDGKPIVHGYPVNPGPLMAKR